MKRRARTDCAEFAPDPTLEANLRLAEESKQQQVEEDAGGEPK